jgi:holo-[acyl-carrier protein] synthase
MILGTGIDLVEVARIRHSLDKFGERFLRRILCPEEVAYCLAHRDPAPFVAGRFAAKEAVSKAFGTGIGRQLGWLDMEVCHKESGEPFLKFHGGAVPLLAARGGRTVHLSLSHTDQHATAIAILEG